MGRKKAKVPLILTVIAVIAAVICFAFGRNYNPYFLWAGLGFSALAILFFCIMLTRFLRNRSITSGLLIATTAVTAVYFVGNRFVETALPRQMATLSVAAADGTTTAAAANGWFTPVLFAQIGLFALWFLLLLFIIYVYVRPIKRIDQLLGQIIDAKEIKKMKLGKGRQYQAIAAKLQILANEKHAAAMKQQARRLQARNRASVKREIVNKILKEQNKIPKPRADA